MTPQERADLLDDPRELVVTQPIRFVCDWFVNLRQREQMAVMEELAEMHGHNSVPELVREWWEDPAPPTADS